MGLVSEPLHGVFPDQLTGAGVEVQRCRGAEVQRFRWRWWWCRLHRAAPAGLAETIDNPSAWGQGLLLPTLITPTGDVRREKGKKTQWSRTSRLFLPEAVLQPPVRASL